MIREGSDPLELYVPASPELRLEFRKDYPYGPDDPYISGLLVRAEGRFVRLEIQALLLGTSGLPNFLRQLYADFRGWSGERVWHSLEGELHVTAVHDGHVHLRWELTHRPYDLEHSWTFSVTTHHEAGEEIRRLGDEFAELLG